MSNGASYAPTRQDVKRGDYPDDPQSGPFSFIVPTFHYYAGLQGQELPASLPYWTPHGSHSFDSRLYKRDRILRYTVNHEPLWAGAVQTFITKIATQKYELSGDKPTVKNRLQELFARCNGGMGFKRMLQYGLRDLATTDNGAFWQIVHQTRSSGSRIVDITHLDSLRCRRTGDPNKPVVYTDQRGYEHELYWWQVMSLSINPDPSEMFYGVGSCPASLCYPTIRGLAMMMRYLAEKVSGDRPLALDFISGLTAAQLNSGIETAKAGRDAKQIEQGFMTAAMYMGSILLPSVTKDGISHVRVNLAELPDGFNRREEIELASYVYANALGLDPQDLMPLSGGSLGSGQQSETLDDKAQGRLPTLIADDLSTLINWHILPDLIEWQFVTNDLRDRKLTAEMKASYVKLAKDAKDAEFIDAYQGQQFLINEDIFDETLFDPAPENTGPLGENEKVNGDGATDSLGAFQYQDAADALLSTDETQAITAKAAQDKQPTDVVVRTPATPTLMDGDAATVREIDENADALDADVLRDAAELFDRFKTPIATSDQSRLQ